MKIHILIVTLTITLSSFAASHETLSFTYISKEQGLSDNNVECIFKDSDGFMWFGTRNGLCRFDGYEIKVYKRNSDKKSISGNRILDIAEDNKGFLWIGTYKDGLNRFDKKTETFQHYGMEHGIGDRVNRIKKFDDGTIWICSNNGLALYIEESDSYNIYLTEKLSTGETSASVVYDILETSTHEVYISSESTDLQKLDRKTQQFEYIPYKRHPQLTSNYKKHIIEDKRGVIWIVASYHGLCSYNPNTKESQLYSAETKNLSTNVLMGTIDMDNEGNMWICTEEDGINIFNTESHALTQLKKNKERLGSLNTNHIYTVFFDDENLAWIGTFDKGVNVYNPYEKKFNTTLFSPNDLSVLTENSVLDIFEDTKGRVWMGTDGNGLFRFENGKEIIHYNHNDINTMLPSNVITSIGEDPFGNILIGNYSGGLISLNTSTQLFKHFYPDKNNSSSISSPHVWEMITDSHKRVWLGMLATGSDQFYFAGNYFKNYGPFSNEANKIDFQNVMAILEDSDGDIWFGTEGKGIFIWDYETDKIVRIESDSISKFSTEGVIKCLLEDKWGNIWIGTEDDGLFMYDKTKRTFKKYNHLNGFTSGSTQSLAADMEGNIWIGTSSGLFCLNTKTSNFTQYITEDGLASNDFNPDAMLKLHDGRIIAGTNNGANVISFDNIVMNQISPKIIFTNLTILNQQILPNSKFHDRIVLEKSITFSDTLVLNYKDKAFSIEFAALNYTLPQKCMYKYKLEGFDENWVYTNSDRRMASYSNLDPGEYTFKVIASNNDGKWGNNERCLKIIIKPPIWNTLIFKLFVGLVLLLIVYVLYKRRINIHKERFKQKQNEQERKIIALENENLEAELKKLAFSIISKNKLLVEQKNRILNLSNQARESVKEGLQKIVNYIDEDLNEEKDWNSIEPQIDKAYNNFITHLKEKHPDLNSIEIRIATYIRMNLSTKEICEFMNKTQRAVENDRYRLRKKIGMESNDSIRDYLMNL